ncbi:MAG: hypothetical protein ACJ71J_11090 [Nitrososphaeraceae archaeon]
MNATSLNNSQWESAAVIIANALVAKAANAIPVVENCKLFLVQKLDFEILSLPTNHLERE